MVVKWSGQNVERGGPSPRRRLFRGRPSGGRKRVPGAAKIRARDLPVFSRMVAAMLDSGIPLVQALAALEEQTSSKAFQSVIAGLRLNIEAGSDFSTGLSEYPEIFDELYVSMMRAGEAGGMLSEIAGRIARYLESSVRLRRKIKSAMMYPAVVMVLAMGIAAAMIIWLIPVFSDIYTDFGSALPTPTRMLVALSDFLRKYFLFVAAGFVALGALFVRWKNSPAGRYHWDAFVLRFPIIGELAKKICMGRFASTFAQLIHSGVPILEALDIVSVAVGNRFVGKYLREARATVESGELLSVELQRHSIFPRMLVYMLSAGEKTGKMDEMLQKVADFYEDEVETALNGLTATIEPLLMVFLGVIVGSIVLGMFMPIFKMTDILNP